MCTQTQFTRRRLCFLTESWYATFLSAAGLPDSAVQDDARAKAAGLPPVDSINQLDLLLSGDATTASHRTEIAGDVNIKTGHVMLISSRNGSWYKLLQGTESYAAW